MPKVYHEGKYEKRPAEYASQKGEHLAKSTWAPAGPRKSADGIKLIYISHKRYEYAEPPKVISNMAPL